MSKNRALFFRPLGVVVLLLISVLCRGPVHAQAPTVQRVPGTTVSLTPPAGFVLATEFSGFKDRDGAASIMVAELPAEAYPQLSTVFGDLEMARKAFATKGISVSALKRVDTSSGPVVFLSGTQTAGTLHLNKWLALLKGQKTVLLTFQAAEASTLTEAAAQKVVESTTLGAVPSLKEKVSELPFKIEATPPFRIVDTIGGSAVLLTAGDKDVDPEGKQPMLIAAIDVSGQAGSGDLAQTARALIAQTQGLKDATVETEKAIRFAGSDGIVLSGKAQDGRYFSQFAALGPQRRFIRMIAFVPPDRADETRPAIESIAQSIAFRP
jgi:hypothetical protein